MTNVICNMCGKELEYKEAVEEYEPLEDGSGKVIFLCTKCYIKWLNE